MRVTFVIAALSAGGAERVISLMANFWARRGWCITILTFDDGTIPPFFEIDQSVCHVPLSISGDSAGLVSGIGNNIRRVSVLRRAITLSRPEAVISFGEKTNVTTLCAARGAKAKTIVSERTDPHMHSIGALWSGLRWFSYAGADRIVVQSPGAQTYFLPRFRHKVAIIPNPVAPPSAKESSPIDRSAQRTILAVGRLSPEKGFDNLLRAFGKVRPQFPDWTLTIIGEGPQRPVLEGLRKKLGLSECVSFPGLVQAPWKDSGSVAIFILSSRFEGFPNALCEAMAHGLPVIATDCPSGPREIIRQGENGVLIPPDDPQALADAMVSLMSDATRRARLGDNARKITERFGIERVMRMWEDVLEPGGE